MKDFWNLFLESGKIDDYLKFKGVYKEGQENSNEPEYYNGVDNKGAESRRE